MITKASETIQTLNTQISELAPYKEQAEAAERKKIEEQRKRLVDVFGLCRYKNKIGYVRIVAQKLSEEQAETSRKHKRRKASKNQKSITQDTVFCAKRCSHNAWRRIQRGRNPVLIQKPLANGIAF